MRKQKNITIIEDGQELRFTIKQMPASELEIWCLRLAGLFARSNLGLPVADGAMAIGEMLREKGLSGLLEALGRLEIDEIRPLLDGLLGCCQYISEPNSLTRLTPQVVDGIVSDVRSLFRLRKEALELNLGFLLPEGTGPGGGLSGSQGKNQPEHLYFNLRDPEIGKPHPAPAA